MMQLQSALLQRKGAFMSFLSDMALEQTEIDVVYRALTLWCQEIGAPIDSADGRDVATVLLALYKTGHTSETALLAAMRRINPEAPIPASP